MRVLITGASGFLGKNVILRAPADWDTTALYRHDLAFPGFVSDGRLSWVRPVQVDLNVPAEVRAFAEAHGTEWDCCLYLAAKVDIPWSVRDPRGDLEANVVPLLNLLDCVKTRKFIYFSSGAVYDGLSGEVTPDAPLAPTLPYAISKLAAERYVAFHALRRESIEDYLIVRFFGAYGPYEASHKIYTRLVRTFGLERKTVYTLYGAGRNLIDAMYVDDAVDAIERMVNGAAANQTVNLAGGSPVALDALVHIAGEALGINPVRILHEGIAHEANNFWGSTREMRELFDFKPRVPLIDGFRRFHRMMSSQ
jgi:nucleoside-diphosphate-sugar epimerase